MTVPGELRVDVEMLVGSAARAGEQGEKLAVAQVSSDNRIGAAQSGWTGSSAAALDARMTAWLATSRMLLTRVGEHALRLNNDAIGFAAMERRNTEELRAVGPGVDSAGSG